MGEGMSGCGEKVPARRVSDRELGRDGVLGAQLPQEGMSGCGEKVPARRVSDRELGRDGVLGAQLPQEGMSGSPC